MSARMVRNQSEGMEIRVAGENGNQQSIAHIGYTLRPGRGLSINYDIFDAALVAENAEAVRESVSAFIAEAFAKATETGIPV